MCWREGGAGEVRRGAAAAEMQSGEFVLRARKLRSTSVSTGAGAAMAPVVEGEQRAWRMKDGGLILHMWHLFFSLPTPPPCFFFFFFKGERQLERFFGR